MSLARALGGLELPYAAIQYIWDPKTAPETILPNANTSRIKNWWSSAVPMDSPTGSHLRAMCGPIFSAPSPARPGGHRGRRPDDRYRQPWWSGGGVLRRRVAALGSVGRSADCGVKVRMALPPRTRACCSPWMLLIRVQSDSLSRYPASH